jgi:hypothetical protein
MYIWDISGQFDHINPVIALTMITLSGALVCLRAFFKPTSMDLKKGFQP